MDSTQHPSDKDKQIEDQIFEHQQHLQLNAAELGDLWSNYMGDSLSSCMFEHFIATVQDDEIKDLLLFNQGISKRHLATIAELFTKEEIPVPDGFGPSDINKSAPRLFEDTYILFYIQQMSISAYGQYTRALTTSIRQDIIDFYQQGIRELNEIYERSTHLLLKKGTISKPPKIPYPKKVDFVENTSFTSVFSKKSRPLASLEIKYLSINISTNILGKALMMGFSQVASSKRLRKLFQTGRDLANKQIKQYGALLTNDNIPSPTLMDSSVTDSQVAPFSDKLMLYHASLANQIGLENIGTSMSRTLRHDIHVKYEKFIIEIGLYSNHGQQLMIDHGWFEQPPLAPDRDKIVRNTIQ
ncbi:DUF3231 family protein [Halobacillus amylolyticus]|uniref:DUF3231 family protein n=1 Tax=Halobacillus amylolyticus TaxID=2932259 RepID=A0ABY4HF04_9BACI|nr:DUF3231 family protein [Halobacillus amylolyticus]UOR13111.1 DUF3231 family protein [Halobacillus amylolyticus]